MKNKLQKYFPMIRTKGAVLEELRGNKKLWDTFCGWKEKYQQEYLEICTGVKGVKLLYDTYFKAIWWCSLKMEVLQMWKFKRLDIYFRGSEVPAILPIYY